MSAEPNLLTTPAARMAGGRFLDAATQSRPAVVLGSVAAGQLGITDASERPRVFLGGRWFTVIGLMAPVELDPDLDRSALVGAPVAETLLGGDGSASKIDVRADPGAVERVRDLLAATAKP